MPHLSLAEQKCFKINVFSLVLNESLRVKAGKSVVRDEISELSLNIKPLIND